MQFIIDRYLMYQKENVCWLQTDLKSVQKDEYRYTEFKMAKSVWFGNVEVVECVGMKIKRENKDKQETS